jgi:hypothetical protein
MKRLGMLGADDEFVCLEERPEFPLDFLLKVRQHSRDIADGLSSCEKIKMRLAMQMLSRRRFRALPKPRP